MKLVYTEVPVTPNLFRGPIIEGMTKQIRHNAVSKDHSHNSILKSKKGSITDSVGNHCN